MVPFCRDCCLEQLELLMEEGKVGRKVGYGGATCHPNTRETKARGFQIQGSYSRHPATEYGPTLSVVSEGDLV